jgi:two-component system chemotaxis response regulator CheB
VAHRDVVVIGASAGGISALLELASALPRGLGAAVFVAVHSSPDTPSLLPELLTRAGALPAQFATDGERFRHGRIYVAPTDRHLLLTDGKMEVTRAPQENGFRPAADPLFRTAAQAHGPRVIGIVLSGGLNDGTYGLAIIKQRGGIAMVQRLDEAMVTSMPLSAIQNVEVDHILAVREMPAVIERLAGGAGGKLIASNGRSAGRRADVAKRGTHGLHDRRPRGVLSPFTCPACHGSLWESRDGRLTRFTCHVGHGFSADSLMNGQDGDIENALWTAVRTLEEKSALRRRMAAHAHRRELGPIARGYEGQAAEAEHQANLIRAIVVNNQRKDGVVPVPRRKRAPRRAARK